MEEGTHGTCLSPWFSVAFFPHAASHCNPLGNNREQTKARTCKPPQPENQKLWHCAQAH